MERRLQRLEQQAVSGSPGGSSNDESRIQSFNEPLSAAADNGAVPNQQPHRAAGGGCVPPVPGSGLSEAAQPAPPPQPPPSSHGNLPAGLEPIPSFVEELKAVSLEATAERHLGSSSGLSFARLTQMVLRRLTPDRADFVFINRCESYGGARLFDFSSPSDLSDPALLESLNDSISLHPILFGDVVLADIVEPSNAIAGLALPEDRSHVDELVDFYFAHSHTLYPMVHRGEFLHALRLYQDNPHDAAAHSPLDLFKIWMVLAIGSTAYSSVSLTEESESRVYYNKALQYLEPAMEHGEMVRTLGLTALAASCTTSRTDRRPPRPPSRSSCSRSPTPSSTSSVPVCQPFARHSL